MGGQQIKLVVALVLLGGAGALFYRYLTAPRADGEDLPQGMDWVCRNADCGNEFNLSLAEVRAQANADGRVPCPKCGQRLTTRGFPCPHCGRLFEPVGHGAAPDNCPHCGEAIGNEGP